MALIETFVFYGFAFSNLLVVALISSVIANRASRRVAIPPEAANKHSTPLWLYGTLALVALFYLGLPGYVILRDQEGGNISYWYSREIRSLIYHSLGRNLVVLVSWSYFACTGCVLVGLGFATRRVWVGTVMATVYLLGFMLVGRMFFEYWSPIVYAASIPMASTILAAVFATCCAPRVLAVHPQAWVVRGRRWLSLALVGATALAFSFPGLSLLLSMMGGGQSSVHAAIGGIRYLIGIDVFPAPLWVALVLATSLMCGTPFAWRRTRLGLVMITTSLIAINLNLALLFWVWALTRGD